MNLDAAKIRLVRTDSGVQVAIDGVARRVGRMVRAFPRTDPERYVGLLDPDGREIGMIEAPSRLDGASRVLMEEVLKADYFVPTILEIRSVTPGGTGSLWEVLTDDGQRTFRIQDREALDGSEAPAIAVTDEDGKRYRIEDYWALDRQSRKAIQDLLPDRVLKARWGGQRSSRGR